MNWTVERKERLRNDLPAWLKLQLLSLTLRVKTKLVWCGHPALGALTAIFILYTNLYFGLLCFLGFLWYQRQEFKEIQKLIKQGKIPGEELGELTDSCARDTRDYLVGFFAWGIIDLTGRISIWISGLL